MMVFDQCETISNGEVDNNNPSTTSTNQFEKTKCQSKSNKRRHVLRYPGDIRDEDLHDFKKAKLAVSICQEALKKSKEQNKKLTSRKWRLARRVKSLKDAIAALRDKRLISENTENVLKVGLIILYKFSHVIVL